MHQQQVDIQSANKPAKLQNTIWAEMGSDRVRAWWEKLDKNVQKQSGGGVQKEE